MRGRVSIMNKKQKKMLIRILIAAALLIGRCHFVPVAGRTAVCSCI